MRRSIALGGALMALGGCGFVPDLESESSFSYAEIVTQAECEIYWSGEELWLAQDNADDPEVMNRDPSKPNYKFSQFHPENYSASIVIDPYDQVSLEAGFGSQFKTSAKAPQYFQWGLSGAGPIAPSTNANSIGKTNGINTYTINTANLYEQVEFDSNPPGKTNYKTVISTDLYNKK